MFARRNGIMCAGQVALDELAASYGTPLYVYSAEILRGNFTRLRQALPDVAIHYAVKANSNQAVLRVLRQAGAGADIVSGGELKRALAAGMAPENIVFSGVGKTDAEIMAALEAGVHQLNVESMPELIAINRIAAGLGRKAPVALRLNPDVTAETHTKTATGRRGDKFGIDHEQMLETAARARILTNVDFVGVTIHIGSQVFDLENYRAAFLRAGDHVRQLRGNGHAITRLDLGGGFAVPYRGEAPFDLTACAAMIAETVGSLGCALAIEPGRYLVAEAGVLLTRVIHLKNGVNNRFAIVDAAMNDLVRPAMYDAYHTISAVRPAPGAVEPVDVVGPVCESSDVFGVNRNLPPLRTGDLLAIETTGAYGAAMSSTYNTRDLVAEVLVDGPRHALIRPRLTVDGQIAMERVPEWL